MVTRLRILLVVGVILLMVGLLYRKARYVAEVTPSTPNAEDASIASLSVSEWPCWRGGKSNGVADASPPLVWSESEGIRWKVAVPGRGHSSPIVHREKVWLTTSREEDESQSLLCFDADRGSLLWEHSYLQGGPVKCHAKNTHASATPACDGKRVYTVGASRGSLWLTAIDHDGNRLWQVEAGPFVSQHGYGSALALYGGLVLVAGENKGAVLAGATSYLAAFRRSDGTLVWRVKRPLEPSYGTPIVAQVAGRSQLLLDGAEHLTALDPSTGRLLWEVPQDRGRSASSVAYSEDIVFSSRTHPAARLLAVRAGTVTDEKAVQKVWEARRGVSDVPSPLVHEGRLYLISDIGVATCLDAATGKELWQERLAGPFSASPVLASGRIHACNEKGDTFVFEAGATYRLLAHNKLDDGFFASPAPLGNRLYLRSERYLYSLEDRAAKVASARPRTSLVPRKDAP